MYLSKEKMEGILQNHNTVLFSMDDAFTAFAFVHEVLCAEVDALKEKEPSATATISRLEEAAYEVFSMGNEIENEEFEEG